MGNWTFAARLRARERLVGYWSQLPVPAVQERAARHGYDYVCFDAQHGFLDYHAVLNGLIGIDAGAALAGSACGGMVRVAANDPALIGQALDAGAQGVIVPLIDTPEQARAAARACRFPPLGTRSYGPMRAGLRSGPRTADMNAEVACIAMIETHEGLANLEAIAAVIIGDTSPRMIWRIRSTISSWKISRCSMVRCRASCGVMGIGDS